MPHRSSDFIDYCNLCDDKSTSSCLRCGRLFCESHKVGFDKRCLDCEEQYMILVKAKGLSTVMAGTSDRMLYLGMWLISIIVYIVTPNTGGPASSIPYAFYVISFLVACFLPSRYEFKEFAREIAGRKERRKFLKETKTLELED